MMRTLLTCPSAHRRFAGVLLVLTFTCFSAMPQTTQSAPARRTNATSGLYRIAGTVVNAVTGEPLRRATVAVLAEENSHAIASVESDNDGHFAIGGLAANKYQLTASKRGYRTAYFDEHEDYSTAIVTGDDQDTSNLTFRLMPGSSIHGVVTADDGEPVENAAVLLFLKPRANKPEDRITQAESVTTDDTGAYEFINLAAGEYLVAVKAEPWFAVHPPARVPGQRPASDAAAPNTALDVAYPITFFNSTNEEASASTLDLAKGNREEANLNLHVVPALRLVVDVPRKQDGSIARPELRQTVFGIQVSAESSGFVESMQTGTTEFTGVAPGHYELEQGDPPRLTELDATASQQVDPTLGTPTVAITGSVRSIAGSPPPEMATLTLESLDGPHRYVQLHGGSPQRGTSAGSVSVPPGEWRVWVFSPNTQLQILTTTVNGKTHPGNLLSVRDRPLSVVVTVSEGATDVRGFARKDGKGMAGIMVVLVPKDLTALQGLVRRDQSDSDGSFSLNNVVPGQYTVVAIEDGWELDWERPEVISRYLPGGIPVTVTDSSGKLLPLSQPVPVQSR